MMEKQQKYCKEKGIPMFAPIDGRCFKCGKQIPDTNEKHITGCPHCCKSFCD